MSVPPPLSEGELRAGVAELHADWSVDGDELVRTFRFANFDRAMAFMQQVAPTCDELNHHPTWSNTYNRVEVRLSTHDAKGLTTYDLQLAGVMDTVAAGS